jgi:phosphoglycerate dehydrogenase-like enzyme
MKVLVTYGPLSPSSIAAIGSAGPGVELVCEHARDAATATALLADDTEVAFMNGLPLSLPPSRRLRWVQIASAGVDTYRSSPAWTDPDILLTTATGVASNSIAEYAMAAILKRAHRLDASMAIKAGGSWPTDEAAYPPLAAEPLQGQTLGVIGYGAVGQRLGWLGRAFGMHIRAVRASTQPPRPGYRPAGLAFADETMAMVTGPAGLDELLETSDHVVIAVPRTPATEGLIGRDALARMKPTSHLVNIARGGIVDEAALVEALGRGRPAFATLDVMDVEPLDPASPLYRVPNLEMTPHIAGYFLGYEDAVAAVFAENLGRYLRDEPLLNLVNRTAGY